MQHGFSRFGLVLLLAVGVAACDDDDDPVQPNPQPALVRLVNAADIPDVDVNIAGTTTPLATDLDFRESTPTCVQVPAGNRSLVFSSTGVDLATVAFDFEENERYTAVLVASGATRRAFVAPDDETASASNNALRFVNATSTPGDIYVTATADDPAAAFLAGGNIGPHATTNVVPAYVHRNTTHTRARLFDVGVTTGNPRADIELTGLPTSRLATVLFVDEGTPVGPTAFIVVPCP